MTCQVRKARYPEAALGSFETRVGQDQAENFNQAWLQEAWLCTTLSHRHLENPKTPPMGRSTAISVILGSAACYLSFAENCAQFQFVYVTGQHTTQDHGD